VRATVSVAVRDEAVTDTEIDGCRDRFRDIYR
jgi:hypothetical protein